MAKDANEDQVRGATKVGGEAASPEGLWGRGVGRAQEAGGRAPDLAQLQPIVAHQLYSLGAGVGYCLWASVAPCVHHWERSRQGVHTEGFGILNWDLSVPGR